MSVPALLADQDALGPVDPDGTILVVSAHTRTGRELLSVSQALRSRNAGAIAYFAACAYHPSSERWSEVRSSLAMGQRPGEFPVEVALDFHLSTPERDAWIDELHLWQRFVEDETMNLDEAISGRHATLEDALRSGGMSDTLFLPNMHGGAQSVQPGFVFYRGLPEATATTRTQADVFFTIAAVLHELRHLAVGEDSLRQFEHTRRVLSPMNFRRYNDGAIQAAFLRAASHEELDYRNDAELSQQMRDLIVNVATAAERREGQAALEFLLAVAVGKVSLVDHDLDAVCDAYLSSSEDLPMRPMVETLVAEVQGLRRRPVIEAQAP